MEECNIPSDWTLEGPGGIWFPIGDVNNKVFKNNWATTDNLNK